MTITRNVKHHKSECCISDKKVAKYVFFFLLQNQQKKSEDLSHATATSKTFMAKACKVLFLSATYKKKWKAMHIKI